MRTLISAIVFSLFTLTPLVSNAGPGGSCHFHGSKPAAQTTILQCANQRKAALVQDGKLDKSWTDIKQASVDYIEGKKGKEWKVVFANPRAPEQTKTNLYLFFTPPGNFIAANHTGQ